DHRTPHALARSLRGPAPPRQLRQLLHRQLASPGPHLQRLPRPPRPQHHRQLLPRPRDHRHPRRRPRLGPGHPPLPLPTGARMSVPWPPPPDLDSLKELFATADVEGLIADECPLDEYDPEAKHFYEATIGFPASKFVANETLPFLEQIWV